MTSVTGAINFALVQTDKRLVMRETWTDNLNNQYIFDYMGPVGADAALPTKQPLALAIATAAQTVQQAVL